MPRSGALLLLLVFLGVAVAQPPAGKKEPVYQNRPLSAWVKDLESPTALIREEAIDVLAGLGAEAKDAADALAGLLKHPSPAIRLKVATALWRIDGRTKPLIEAIVQPGRADNPQTTRDRIRSLAALGPDAAPALPFLLDQLRDGSTPEVAQAAVLAIQLIGPDAVPLLVKRTESDDAQTRRAAVTALGNLGPLAHDAANAVLKLMKDKDTATRLAAAQAYWRIEHKGEPVAEVVLPLLEGKDAGQGDLNTAKHLLTQLRTAPKVAAPVWKALLDKGTLGPTEKVTLAETLWQADPANAREAVPLLTEALKEPAARGSAVRVLSMMGPAAKDALPAVLDVIKAAPAMAQAPTYGRLLARIGTDAVPQLVELATSKDRNLGTLGRYALASMGEAGVKPLLEAMEKEKGPERLAFLLSLAQVGPSSKAIVPALKELLQDNAVQNRRTALSAITNLGPSARELVPDLLKLFKDPAPLSPFELGPVLEAVGADPKDVRADLLQLATKHTVWTTRIQAAKTLLALSPGDKDAILALAGELSRTPVDPPVRNQAVQLMRGQGANLAPAAPAITKALEDASNPPALLMPMMMLLGEIGPGAKESVPVLTRLLGDKTPGVRLDAAFALAAIAPETKGITDVLVTDGLIKGAAAVHPRTFRALGAIGAGAKDAVPTILDLMTVGDASVRIEAAEALVRIDPARKWTAQTALRELLAQGNRQAALALWRMDPKDRFPVVALTTLLGQAPDQVDIIDMLGQMGPDAKSALPVLRTAAVHGPPFAPRWQIPLALWKITGKTDEAIPLLVAMAQNTDLDGVRVGALRALGQLGADAKEARKALEAATLDPDVAVRRAAREALRMK